MNRVLITGASSGIGRALAMEYAARGARLVLTARRESMLNEVAADVVRAGGEAAVLAADITKADTPARLLELAKTAYGGLDIIVLNAGGNSTMFADNFDVAAAEAVMDLNFTAAMRLAAAALPRFIAERRGHVVAISSLASLRGVPGGAAYSASKAAIDRLMESLRTELRGTGIRFTTIFPGFVRTPIIDQNEFPMPFLIEADDAARRIIRAVERGRSSYSFPLPTALAMKLARFIPDRLYDWLATSVRPRPTS